MHSTSRRARQPTSDRERAPPMPTRRGSGRSTVRPPGRALHATLKSEELAHSAQSDALSGGESKQQHALPGLLRLPRVAAPSPGLLRRPPGTAPWTRIGARRRAQGWRLRGSSQARRWHPRPGTYGVGHPKSQMLSSKDHVATPITSGSGHRRRHPRNICAAIPYAADTQEHHRPPINQHLHRRHNRSPAWRKGRCPDDSATVPRYPIVASRT